MQLASEDFAVRNNGVYAANTNLDTGTAGATIVSMLPSGALLTNPFTKLVDVPLASGVAAAAGQTGYVPVVQNLVNVGYSITGYGQTALVLTLISGQ